MPVLPDDHCASQYNVGTLDIVGVTIVWFTVFRWILLVALADDINILFCQPNPKRRGSSEQTTVLHLVLFIASPIYTIVQAANCRDHFMKLNVTIMVFLFIYEQIFTRAKDRLKFEFLGYCCGFMFPDIIAIAAGAVAITEGGSWRVFGIVIVVLFCLMALCNKYRLEGELHMMMGPSALKFTVLYPVYLAVFVTVLVRDQGQWIPRPSTLVEYIMFVTRCVAGFGGIDVLGAIGSKIYRRIVPEVEESPDVEPWFNWHSVRIDPDLFEDRDGKGYETRMSTW